MDSRHIAKRQNSDKEDLENKNISKTENVIFQIPLTTAMLNLVSIANTNQTSSTFENEPFQQLIIPKFILINKNYKFNFDINRCEYIFANEMRTEFIRHYLQHIVWKLIYKDPFNYYHKESVIALSLNNYFKNKEELISTGLMTESEEMLEIQTSLSQLPIPQILKLTLFEISNTSFVYKLKFLTLDDEENLEIISFIIPKSFSIRLQEIFKFKFNLDSLTYITDNTLNLDNKLIQISLDNYYQVKENRFFINPLENQILLSLEDYLYYRSFPLFFTYNLNINLLELFLVETLSIGKYQTQYFPNDISNMQVQNNIHEFNATSKSFVALTSQSQTSIPSETYSDTLEFLENYPTDESNYTHHSNELNYTHHSNESNYTHHSNEKICEPSNSYKTLTSHKVFHQPEKPCWANLFTQIKTQLPPAIIKNLQSNLETFEPTENTQKPPFKIQRKNN